MKNKTTQNNAVEDELDTIRIKLHEQTKDMTSKEQTSFFNNRAREIIAQHGLKVNFVKAPIIRQHVRTEEVL